MRGRTYKKERLRLPEPCFAGSAMRRLRNLKQAIQGRVLSRLP